MSVTFINAAEAADLIQDRSTVAIDGFIGFCLADDILTAIEKRYIREDHPRDLSVVNVAGLGGDGQQRGINHFAHRGLMRRFLCSNLSLAPKLYPLIMDNVFPTFMMPQGVLSHMMRAIAAHRPGIISQVGMKTFVDPRIDGGKSKADTKGNISVEKEALHIEQFERAAAAKNSGGIVMGQVDEIVEHGQLHPQMVTVPSALVDYVILGDPENSGQHFIGNRKPVPSWCGDEKIPFDNIESLPFDIHKVICRRGILELHAGDFINLGIGIPMGISEVLNEEGLIEQISSSIESGVTGGVPAPGIATGAAYNPEAILKQPDIFDFYDGGGIDFAGLGAAEIDRHGNVNVSKFAGKVTGPGGFINISQGAKTVCFLGTFTAGKSDIKIRDGKLEIVEDGPYIKFKNDVEHITFSGHHSREKGLQNVFYITERAVFRLTDQGLTLIEIAPGADLDRDILGKMEFRPAIAPRLKTMDSRLFRSEKMNLSLENV